MKKYIYDYSGFSFTLVIHKYWSEICNGKPKEELYHDYKVMLEQVKAVDKKRYILDIGANCGIFAVPAAMLGYKVFGFEPVKMNVNSLLLAKEENNLTNFDIFHAALSNENKEVDIFVPECHDNASLSCEAAISNMVGKEFTKEKTQAFRFDDWIKEHDNFSDIGLVKIDIQGGEYDALQGMKEYLTNAKDIYLICEYENHLYTMGHTFKELDDLIASYGFHCMGYLVGNDKIWKKQL